VPGAASSPTIVRLAAVLLWALVLWNVVAYRGLFWDGASMLTMIIDGGWFEWRFYSPRAHVMWLTQAPVVAAVALGVRDTSVLALCYSASLFALPTAIYHLALWRVRHQPAALALVLTVIAGVYLPTWFFILSEFQAAAAIAVAGMAIVATASPRLTVPDSAILVGFGLVAVRSYETMVYLGLLLGVAIAWRVMTSPGMSRSARVLGWLAVVLFVGASVVSALALAEYWRHPHFQSYRGGILQFWENLQFVLALATVLPTLAVLLVWPELLKRWPVYALSALPLFMLALSGELHRLAPATVIFAPSHYVARAGAGLLLLVLLAGWFLLIARPRLAPRIAATLADEAAGRRMSLGAFGFMLAAMAPDLALTSRWSEYRRTVQEVVQSRTGRVLVADTVIAEARFQPFFQDWSYPALSLMLRRTPGDAVLFVPRSNHPWKLNPEVWLPTLEGYAWRR
jgi:hypothetical protein